MMKALKCKHGFTLMEVLIGLSIISIGLFSSYSLLVTSYKYFWHSYTIAQTRQEVRLLLSRIERELRDTSASNIEILEDNQYTAISFPSAKYWDDIEQKYKFDYHPKTGRPVWQKAVVYYLDHNTNKLYRYEEAKTDWSVNFDPSLAIGADGSQQIGENISQLSFDTSLLGTKKLLGITLADNQQTDVGKTSLPLSTQIPIYN